MERRPVATLRVPGRPAADSEELMVTEDRGNREKSIERLLDEARERAHALAGDYAAMVEAARRRETWVELGTGLSIGSVDGVGDAGAGGGNGGDAQAAETLALDDAAISELVDGVDETGYFVVPQLIDTAFIDRLRDGVERVRAAGWPPVFIAVFDEFWTVVRTPSFVRLASSLLGMDTGICRTSGRSTSLRSTGRRLGAARRRAVRFRANEHLAAAYRGDDAKRLHRARAAQPYAGVGR
ncbi:MAG: hypothetical protein IPF82_16930 [Blastocatellia bacterium]|nr:hypothetical protein [Blastocatellia bacterium]